MFVFKRLAAVAAVLAVGAAAAPAQANVITFETAPVDTLVSPVTENGFTYSTDSGLLTVDTLGNPGHDLEGGAFSAGGGFLKIVSAGAPDFMFNSTDFADFNVAGTGSQTLGVEGLLGGSVVAFDLFTLANTNDISSGSFANWTTESASVLQGKTIDELRINLTTPAGNFKAVDNVTLTPTAVPEPASWAMILLGVGGIGAALRLGGRGAGRAVLA